MQKLGMNALLGVGQGSAHDSRMVVMQWNGARKGAVRKSDGGPLAFIGKACASIPAACLLSRQSMMGMKATWAAPRRWWV